MKVKAHRSEAAQSSAFDSWTAFQNNAVDSVAKNCLQTKAAAILRRLKQAESRQNRFRKHFAASHDFIVHSAKLYLIAKPKVNHYFHYLTQLRVEDETQCSHHSPVWEHHQLQGCPFAGLFLQKILQRADTLSWAPEHAIGDTSCCELYAAFVLETKTRAPVKVPVKDGKGKNRFRWTLRDQSLETHSICTVFSQDVPKPIDCWFCHHGQCLHTIPMKAGSRTTLKRSTRVLGAQLEFKAQVRDPMRAWFALYLTCVHCTSLRASLLVPFSGCRSPSVRSGLQNKMLTRTNGCGSNIGTPNGTLVRGNMDQSLRSPGGLILTHTQMGAQTPGSKSPKRASAKRDTLKCSPSMKPIQDHHIFRSRVCQAASDRSK